MADLIDYMLARKALQKECQAPTAPDHPLTWVPDTVEFLSIFGPRRSGDSLVEFHAQKIEMRKERFAKEKEDFEKCQSHLPKVNYYDNYYNRNQQNYRRRRAIDQFG